MSVQMGVAVRNARLDAIETALGTAPLLKIYTGAQPADCAASAPSGLIATMTLPSNWMNDASSGTKTLNGTWSVAASGTGTAASWRIYDSGGTVCGLQGNMSDLVLDNTSIASGQTITITSFTITEGNA